MPHISLPYALGALLVTILATAGGFMMAALPQGTQAEMRLEPNSGVLQNEELFTLNVVAEANVPVNVFQGNIHFDSKILTVQSIEYNTSIADLWAEEPWYNNGDGTLTFIGGTTMPGGFTGTGELITINFSTKNTGKARIDLQESTILQHDGLGTQAQLTEPIDAIFTVTDQSLTPYRVGSGQSSAADVYILSQSISTDLNQDGQTSLIDVSIFMRYLATQNKKGDLNGDQIVGTRDLSILLDAI
tara:strand:+ start:232 stop:966 length:735 start_codon:yes stop_codon:yes gene_type:complete